MDDRKTGRRQRTRIDGWSIATALGLMAAAFLIDHEAPINKPAKDLDPPSDTKRDASPAGLAFEGEDRGRQATSPAEIPAKGWKDILWRVYANIDLSQHPRNIPCPRGSRRDLRLLLRPR